jgi:N,N-dimethylformamidase
MSDQAIAPPLAKRIIGYCDPLSAAPGDQVRFFVSCSQEVSEYKTELVRPRAGAPGWEETGPECTVIPAAFSGTYPARHQDVYPGSYVLVPGGASALGPGPITIAVLVQPTFQPGTDQALVSVGDPAAGTGFAIVLDHELRPAVVSAEGDGVVLTADRLPVGAWSLVVVVMDEGSPVPADTSTAAPEDLLFGAVRRPGSRETRMHFTGRMESPAILPGRLTAAAAAALLSAGPRASQASRMSNAWWDFSAEMNSWTAVDRGPARLHGTLRNLPMRAVRGSRWEPGTDDWRAAPEQYAALHFLADALEDCGWDADFSFDVPDDARSGFYAVRITSGTEVEYIPFFIRPPDGAEAPILLIAPTATYASYGNSRFWWENPIQEMVQDRLVELGAEEQYLITHPELGASSYDCHLDGTDICYVSRLRPNLNMRPGHVRREGYTSDLYLIAWLDRLRASYHVVTDEDLHLAGRSLLDRYTVVLTGSHPEYMSARMFDAFDDWTAAGGRLMYLGGNGFSMNVTFHPERPWVMENRRVDLWERPVDFAAAEALNSTDGLRGGYFQSSGRRPAALIGVESATMGFDHSYPYTLAAAATRPEAAFVFDGVQQEVLADGLIGDFGALGGGVVGQEWDNAAGFDLGPGHLILASSRDHTLIPPLFGAVRPDYHADLVLYFRGAGAVFSVSSMSWCGALGDRDYDNEIAQITGNVLARFADSSPFPPLGGTA